MPRKNSFGVNVENNFPMIAWLLVLLLILYFYFNKSNFGKRGSGPDNTTTDEGCNNTALAGSKPSTSSNGYFTTAASIKGIQNIDINKIIGHINNYNNKITDPKNKIVAFSQKDNSYNNKYDVIISTTPEINPHTGKRMIKTVYKTISTRGDSLYFTKEALAKAVNNKLQISAKSGSAFCSPIKGVNTYCLDKNSNIFNNCLSKIK